MLDLTIMNEERTRPEISQLRVKRFLRAITLKAAEKVKDSSPCGKIGVLTGGTAGAYAGGPAGAVAGGLAGFVIGEGYNSLVDRLFPSSSR